MSDYKFNHVQDLKSNSNSISFRMGINPLAQAKAEQAAAGEGKAGHGGPRGGVSRPGEAAEHGKLRVKAGSPVVRYQSS